MKQKKKSENNAKSNEESKNETKMTIEDILQSYLNSIQKLLDKGVKELNGKADDLLQSEQDTKEYCIDVLNKAILKVNQFLITFEKYVGSEEAVQKQNIEQYITSILKLISSIMWFYSMGINKTIRQIVSEDAKIQEKREADKHLGRHSPLEEPPLDNNFDAVVESAQNIKKINETAFIQYAAKDAYFKGFLNRSNKFNFSQATQVIPNRYVA
jgi:hypothetical protein